MAAGEIRKGDIGTVFKATIKDGTSVVDVSSATTLQLFFLKPDGDIVTRTATLTGGGTDGVIQYKTVSGDLDQVGSWVVQGNVVLDASNSFKSSKHTFIVHDNIV